VLTVFSLLPPSAKAATPNYLISKKFKYAGAEKDLSATYYYSDTYFSNSSYAYNQHLATMSLCLAISSFGSSEVAITSNDRYRNANKIFQEIGFKDFEANSWFTDTAASASIGAVMANKKIRVGNRAYTVVALMVGVGSYTDEWASDVKVGSSGMHQGFREARDELSRFLTKYLSQKGITGDIKLWISGFSRSAAAANLLSGAIDEDKSFIENTGCSLALSNLYNYNFNAPMGTLLNITGMTKDQNVYNNIFNLVNPLDPIMMVPPKAWGFVRYGIDLLLFDQNTTSYQTELAQMQRYYVSLDGFEKTPYRGNSFKMKNSPLSIPLSMGH
jgi:hypothetical protein